MTTTVGAVVQPGSVLVTLVPQREALMAEVYIRNDDIGFVREGQSVRIKVAAYPFTKYGMVEGIVRTVSADASQASKNSATESSAQQGDSSMFKAIIDLSKQHLDLHGALLPLAAGMQVSGEIREDKRTVFEYLLSPIRRIAAESAQER